jgi:molybdate transport system substrate-binding protein
MAGELRIFALQSPQLIINELTAAFAQQTGYTVTQLLGPADLPVQVQPRLDAGEAFDAAFLTPAMLRQLAAVGKVHRDSQTPFLRVPIGVAVRTGAPRPEIGSVEAFLQAVRQAGSIAYLKAGVSGPYLDGLFDRFGLAAEVRGKALRPDTDTVGELVAQGKAELGITAVATLLATPGIEVIGPLPAEIQSYVRFDGAVSAHTEVPEVARQLIAFVTGPAARPVIRAKGMEAG